MFLRHLNQAEAPDAVSFVHISNKIINRPEIKLFKQLNENICLKKLFYFLHKNQETVTATLSQFFANAFNI